jgi:hypothetical protein
MVVGAAEFSARSRCRGRLLATKRSNPMAQPGSLEVEVGQPRRGDGWSPGRVAETCEDGLDHLGLGDRGDDLGSAPALPTFENIFVETPHQQLRPSEPSLAEGDRVAWGDLQHRHGCRQGVAAVGLAGGRQFDSGGVF